MFTGIVQGKGRVIISKIKAIFIPISLNYKELVGNLETGASVQIMVAV